MKNIYDLTIYNLRFIFTFYYYLIQVSEEKWK